MRLHVRSIGDAYTGICQTVLRQGEKVSPRGIETRELLDAVIIAEDPSDSLPTGCGRVFNSAIAVAEAAQLVGAISDPELMTTITPNFAQFMDDGRFHGAYGRRIGDQAFHVVDKLTKDRDTRQAVITLWDPSLDNTPGKHDYPCTVSLTFTIRRDALNLHVTMRSNDVWWGLAYDAFQFTTLQYTVAHALDVPVGRYHHHAVSLHAYVRDSDRIESLWETRDSALRLTGFGRSGDDFAIMATRARHVVHGWGMDDPTPTEQWMLESIRKFRETK